MCEVRQVHNLGAGVVPGVQERRQAREGAPWSWLFARAVCVVETGRWPFRKDLAEEMLKVGLASVYRQAGAQYGGKLLVYEKLEAQAKKKKVGMWSLGDKLETAAEYKKRTATKKH